MTALGLKRWGNRPPEVQGDHPGAAIVGQEPNEPGRDTAALGLTPADGAAETDPGCNTTEQNTSQPVAEEGTDAPLASWPSRAGSFAVDFGFGFGVVATMAVVALMAPWRGWLWWAAMAALGLAILAMAVNRTVVPSLWGWTLGRALFGLRVVRPGRQPSPGPWRLLLRDLAHLLDTAAVFVGWLWPLWDSRRRTFADLLLGTEVWRAGGERRDVRRLCGAVLVAGVLLATAAAGLSYLTVYRYDQAVDQARAEISARGPEIVEEMLSYGAGTMKEDFARAQSVVTDGYRPQLIEQQQAVQKGDAATNEYWAVASSVLSVSPDTAEMLIFLQGQRQAAQQEPSFITATVRVDFQKSAEHNWQLGGLAVLTRPLYGAS